MGRLTDDGDEVLGGLELPESDVDGDTALALGLELVKNPGILEGALAELSGFLFVTLSVFCVPRMDWETRRDGRSRGKLSVPQKKKCDPPFVCPSPTKIREGQCTKAESRGKCADTQKRILCDGNFRPGQDGECDEDGNSETNLLELLNGTLVDTTALVDQVAGLETLSARHDIQRRWE